MVRVMATMFTHNGNQKMFFEAFRALTRSLGILREKSLYIGNLVTGDNLLGFLVIDFSKEFSPSVKKMVGYGFPCEIFYRRPGEGFCSNINFALSLANDSDIDYLIQVNDDAFVHPGFVYQAVVMMKRTNAAFIGGTPQDDGKWNSDPKELYYPEMVDQTRTITNFVHGNWEMSGCIMDVKKILECGGMDENFDNYLGLCGDNDLFLRLAKKGENIYATRLMRFWHSRGVTQSKFGRDPYDPKDSVKAGAVAYLKKKWGVDISENPTATIGDFNLVQEVI